MNETYQSTIVFGEAGSLSSSFLFSAIMLRICSGVFLILDRNVLDITMHYEDTGY